MSILTDLQGKNLGFIELISMGFDIYFKKLKSILSLYLVSLFPFQVILYLIADLSQKGVISTGIYLILFLPSMILIFISSSIYFIGISILVENFIYKKNNNPIKMIGSRIGPLIFLSLRFTVNLYLRSFLFFIPGIIYAVNNAYYGLAYILRDQRGKAAFIYSHSIVKDNWWKVFFFSSFTFIVTLVPQTIFSKVLDAIPLVRYSGMSAVISQALSSIISVGPGIASILLFFNLDFRKQLEN